MKKYLLIVTVVALGLSVAACSGKKSENATETPVQPEVVTATVSDSAAIGNDLLTKYETVINKIIELQAKGDAASVEELKKLNEEATAVATELQNAIPNFTPEQQQKFADLAKKLVDAAQAAAPKAAKH